MLLTYYGNVDTLRCVNTKLACYKDEVFDIFLPRKIFTYFYNIDLYIIKNHLILLAFVRIRRWNLKFILKIKTTSCSHFYTMWECWLFNHFQRTFLVGFSSPCRLSSLQVNDMWEGLTVFSLLISLVALDQHKILFPLSICWPQWPAEVHQPLLTSVISLRAIVYREAFPSLRPLC